MSGMPPFDAIAAELRLIAHHEGPGVWRDRSRLTGLLLDQQPELRREIRAVVTAVEQGVAQSLTGCEPSLTAITIDRQANLLESEANLRSDIAQNVTRAIAHALNLGPLPSIYGPGGGSTSQPIPAPAPVGSRPPERGPGQDPRQNHGQSHGQNHGQSHGHSQAYGQPHAPAPMPQAAWDGSHGQWGGPPPGQGKSNRGLIIGTSVVGGAVVVAGIVLALTLGGGGSAGNNAAGTSTAGTIDAAFLQGRWCDTSNSWMTFDSATSQINLPNGNTGERVIANYALANDTLSVTGPSGVVQTIQLARLDAQTMNFTFQSMPTERVRRC